MSTTASDKQLRERQIVTVAMLVAGYSGYYLCRSDLAVALPLIIQETARQGVSPELARIRFGSIASIGVLAYAIGKFLAGPIADAGGGKRSFLGGMAGSVVCTALFAMTGTFPLFMAAWTANRAVQSFGWAGAVKLISRWFSAGSYGIVMAIVSLSFLFGDAAARTFLSVLIANGFNWRGVFFIAAAVLFGLFVIGVVSLRESPRDVGLDESAPTAGASTSTFRAGVIGELFKTPAFWMVCVLSIGLTLIRETFNFWTASYFNQALGMSPAEAAARSALLPLFGGVSVLAAGYASDRFGPRIRAGIIFASLLTSAALLVILGTRSFGRGSHWPVWLTVAVSFLMIGPYSYLAGAIALDFGGKRVSATASGIIDGSGYLGGVLAGDTIARISVLYGWTGAFLTLAAVCAVLTIVAAFYWREQHKGRSISSSTASHSATLSTT